MHAELISGRTASLQRGAKLALLLVILLSALASFHPAAAQTTITAYKSTIAVNVKAAYSPSQWTDTPLISERFSGMSVAFKQNGTGLLFLMMWSESAVCGDTYCFGGVELGFLNNTAEMGTPTTPTVMVLASTSFKGNMDEFISYGDLTPSSVENFGYSTQSVCGLALTGKEYTVECYRPFVLHNASPYDAFPSLAAGNPIEIGFAVGEFATPGDHAATDMSTYVLTLSSQTYTTTSSSTTSTITTSTTTSSTTSSSTSSSSSSTTTTKSTTTTSSSTTSTSTSTTTSTTSPVTTTTTSTTTTTATQTVTTTLPVTTTITSTATQTVTGPPSTITSTATQTVTGPPSTITSTVTAPPITLTGTQTTTQTATSTVTQTTSAIPDWAYGAMVLLLLIGLAIGNVVKRPSVKQT